MQVAKPDDFPIADEIYGQSDRGAAIVAAAYLDDCLTSAIAAALARDDASKKVFSEFFAPEGPGGGLVAKAKLAFLLGFFSEETLKDIKRIAKIRNKLAHRTGVRDFSDASVRDTSAEISYWNRSWRQVPIGTDLLINPPFDQAKARKAFIVNIGAIAAMLEAGGRAVQDGLKPVAL